VYPRDATPPCDYEEEAVRFLVERVAGAMIDGRVDPCEGACEIQVLSGGSIGEFELLVLDYKDRPRMRKEIAEGFLEEARRIAGPKGPGALRID
jgi:hypothetical protein